MASYTLNTGEFAAHAKTLAANVVDTVTFPGDIDRVEIISDGASEIYYTIDGADPTIGGAATFMIPAQPMAVQQDAPAGGPTTVKLISAGTPRYWVMRAFPGQVRFGGGGAGGTGSATPVYNVGLTAVEETWRRNTDAAQLLSAARTATVTGLVQPDNFYTRGVRLTLDVTAAPNTADTIQLVLEHLDPYATAGTGKWMILAQMASALVGTATQAGITRMLSYGPAAVSNGGNTNHEVFQGQIARAWRVRVIHVGTGSWTYSVGAAVLI